MGTSLKENRNSWFARIIVIVLAIAFIVGLGYTGGFQGVSGGVAAEVNGEPIPIQYYHLVRGRIFNEQTKNLDKIPLELREAIDRVSLAFLIDRKLLAQGARSLGFRALPENVASAVKANPSFSPDGVFAGPEYYKYVVTQQLGMTVSSFEETIRDEELVMKMAALASVSSAWSPLELEILFSFAGEKVKADYISFDSRSEARKALKKLQSSGDLSAVASEFGKETVTTPFFTRFEVPDNLDVSLFALTPSSPVAEMVFSSDGVHTVAVLSERQAEKPQTVQDKVRIATEYMQGRGADRDVMNDWMMILYSKADIKENRELLR